MVQCEPSCAGRFVIGLQLLSWCAVGAILLHRGFASIQLKKTENVPDVRPLRANFTADLTPTEATFDGNNRTDAAQLADDETTPSYGDTWVDELETSTESFVDVDDGQPLAGRTPTHVHNVRVATPKPKPTSSNKKLYELTASGLVMVALGAVMLVVGPSVVILRCCDAVGQGRRFNKLSADDTDAQLAALDLPPPYDEVADIEADADADARAPRYSMIFPESFDEDVEEIRSG